MSGETVGNGLPLSAWTLPDQNGKDWTLYRYVDGIEFASLPDESCRIRISLDLLDEILSGPPYVKGISTRIGREAAQ